MEPIATAPYYISLAEREEVENAVAESVFASWQIEHVQGHNVLWNRISNMLDATERTHPPSILKLWEVVGWAGGCQSCQIPGQSKQVYAGAMERYLVAWIQHITRYNLIDQVYWVQSEQSADVYLAVFREAVEDNLKFGLLGYALPVATPREPTCCAKKREQAKERNCCVS